MTETVPTHGLTLRRDLQARLSGVNADTVEDYRRAMANGEVFPPIVVYRIDGSTLVLVDGWHRVRAAKEAGITELEAEVIDGTETEAIDYALYQANRKNGQRLSRADLRYVLEQCVRDPRYAQVSDRQIGEHVGVSHTTVSRTRKRLGLTPTSVVGADGRLVTTKGRHKSEIIFGMPAYAPPPPGNAGYPVLTGRLSDNMVKSMERLITLVEWVTDEDRARLESVCAKIGELFGERP